MTASAKAPRSEVSRSHSTLQILATLPAHGQEDVEKRKEYFCLEVKNSSTEEPRPELSQKNNNQADWCEGFVLGRQEQHEQKYRGTGHC